MTDKNYEDGDMHFATTDNSNQHAVLVKKIWEKPGLIINLSAGNQQIHGGKPQRTSEVVLITTYGPS